jgi:hypothetical protein
MKKIFTRTMLLVIFSLGIIPSLFASHIVGLEMSFECLNPATRQYRFTVSYAEVCPSSLTGMSQTLTFEALTGGCANFTATATQVGAGVDQRQQICATQVTNCSGGTFASVMRYTLQVDVTLPPGCNWRVSTGNCCRANAITNLTTPGSYGNYIEITIDQNTTMCNNSPTFASQPVLYACAGQVTSYNHGTIDVDGDSLVYQLIDPRDYISPYPNVPFIAGLSATTPLLLAPATSFGFNTQTGQMTFTPQAGTNQIAIVVVQIFEYRNGVLIGSYIRELQITVSNTCTNNNPATSPVNNIGGSSLNGNTFSTCPGNVMNFQITATDPDVGQILTATHNIATNLPGATVLTVGTNPLTLNVTWPVPLAPLPFYTFTVTFSDNACPIQGQQILGFLIDIGANVTIQADSIYCPPGPEIKSMDAVANPGIFSWSPAGGLSCTNCASPTVTVGAPITYTVTYTDAATGCSAVASHSFSEHRMDVVVNPAGPVQWCTGDPGVPMSAQLNSDPGTVIVPNPDRYDISSVAFNAVGGGGWTTVTLSDDQVSGAVPIGFNFTFFGNNYTTGYISSNGFFTFTSTTASGCCSGQVLPSGTTPNDLIALVWNDLYPPGAGTIRYKTIGTAPNRQYILQFNGIPRCCGTVANVTVQMVLFETTNCVEIHTTSQNSTGNATTGLENAAGSIAWTVPGRNGQAFTVSTPDAFRWCPADDTIGTGISYLWSPAGGVSNPNAQNPTITPTSEPMSYTVTCDDGICAAQRSVSFSCVLLGADCQAFKAEFANNKVSLNWETVGEEDVQGFAIERSIDGISFEQIGFVNSKGNTTLGHNYNYVDNQNISRGQIYYYRLIQEELNGTKSQVCDALSVSTGESVISSVSVRPNPIREQVELTIHSNSSGQVDIQVLDVLGHSVSKKNNNVLQQGINVYTLELKDLPAGVYYLRIGNQKLGFSTQRLVKVNP